MSVATAAVGPASVSNRRTVALAAVLMQVVLGGVQAWSVLRNPLMQASGWTVSEVTFAFSLNYFVYGLSAFVGGLLMGRIGSRAVAMLAGVLFGSGLLLSTFAADRIWVLYLGFGVVGGCGRGFGYVAPAVVLVKWFPDRRGFVSGLGNAAYGSGALFAAPVFTGLVGVAGVFETFAIAGVGVIVSVVAIACFMSSPPDGYRPAGWEPSAAGADQRANHDFTLREALGTWQYYALYGTFLAMVIPGMALISQISPMAQEMTGVDSFVAAGLVGAASVASVAGRFLWAWMSDRIGRLRVILLLFVVESVALAIMPSATSFLLFSVLVCIVLSCFGGGVASLPPVAADYFGPKHVGAIFGLTMTAAGIGTMLGSSLLAHVRETGGGYGPALYVFAVITALTTLVALAMRPPTWRSARTNRRLWQLSRVRSS